LKEYVDTLLVISNDKLRHQFGNLTMRAAFSTADNVLATAAKCITDVISSTGQINVDFADVCTVMRNGGVAILGSATAEGENRAQLAIEQALNSPLLNDNDIRGAKWILININSAEGEFEFTMDEVEIIQQYLLNHAGPESDVILGMGYDNGLGNQIGITLIATGFEHKNPFDRPGAPAEEKEKVPEKIILKLDTKEPGKAEISPLVTIAEEKDEMAPTLVDLSQNIGIQFIVEEDLMDVPLSEEKEIIHFELSSLTSSTQEQIPTKDQQLEVPAPQIQISLFSEKDDKEASSTLTSSGFLARPSNIYAEEPSNFESNNHGSLEEPNQKHKEEDPSSDMQLVIKENQAADEPVAPSIHVTMAPVEEPALQDETDDQRRKAAERLHKLRNLSFNLNAADPNNEFENVPAYIRRNLHVHNTALTSVEKFYSNYTVKTDENNKGQISTLNTFLEGKKPD